MTTKTNNIVYWIATICPALGMASTGAMQLVQPQVLHACRPSFRSINKGVSP